jgi:hypothetical protein
MGAGIYRTIQAMSNNFRLKGTVSRLPRIECAN